MIENLQNQEVSLPETKDLTKKKPTQPKKMKSSVSITLTYDLTNEDEKSAYDEIKKAHQDLFQIENVSFSIKMKDWLKLCFAPPKKRKSMEIKKQFITKDSKIEVWTIGYNKAEDKSITEKDFIIDVLPTVSKRELDRFINLALSK